MSVHSSSVDSSTPRLSVIVPVRPNSPELVRCLASLTASGLPRSDWELIVVTNTRDQDSWLVSALHADTVLRLPDGPWGASYARNRGVEVSRAPHLLFVSADVCVKSDALSGFLEVFDRETDVGAVCGTYVDDEPRSYNQLAAYQSLVHQFRCEFGAGFTDTFTPGFAAIRRELFLNAGMFDEWRVEVPHIESAEFGRRLLTLGGQIVVRPHLRASHLKHWTLVRALGQSVRDPGIPWQQELCIATERLINPGLRMLRRIDAAGMLCVWSALGMGAFGVAGRNSHGGAVSIVLLLLALLTCLPACWFVARRRSIGFALLMLPIHYAKLILAGIGVTYNWLVRHIVGEPRPAPAIEAFAEVGLTTWPPVPQRRPPREIRTQSA